MDRPVPCRLAAGVLATLVMAATMGCQSPRSNVPPAIHYGQGAATPAYPMNPTGPGMGMSSGTGMTPGDPGVNPSGYGATGPGSYTMPSGTQVTNWPTNASPMAGQAVPGYAPAGATAPMSGGY